MRQFLWLVACASLFFSSPSIAASWGKPSGTAATLGASVSYTSSVKCWTFTIADGTNASTPIAIFTETALFSFDPDTAAAVKNTAEVELHYCPMGYMPSTSPEKECGNLGGAQPTSIAFDGTEGDESVQNWMKPITNAGVYYVKIKTQCESGKTCRACFNGEGSKSQ